MKELYKYCRIPGKFFYAPKFWQKKKRTFVFPQTLFFTTKKKFLQKKFWSWKIGVGEKQKSFFAKIWGHKKNFPFAFFIFFSFFVLLILKHFLVYICTILFANLPFLKKKKERDALKQCQRVIVFQRIMTHVWVLGNFFLKKILVNTFGFWLQLWDRSQLNPPWIDLPLLKDTSFSSWFVLKVDKKVCLLEGEL